jgi:N-acetylglutamate synthase-like GNAT family acetyltransferase
MSSPGYRVRRATVDDLDDLRRLWQAMHLPAAEFEKRITEFQVVEDTDGRLIGALGVELAGRHGRVYGESFSDFALADTLRELLWQRMKAVASNHGLARFWTHETAPFWKQCGFQAPAEAALKKLPPAWSAESARLFTLQLRDEEALEKALDANFALLKEEERRETEKMMQQGRILKYVATLLAFMLAIGVAVISIRLLLDRFGVHR